MEVIYQCQGVVADGDCSRGASWGQEVFFKTDGDTKLCAMVDAKWHPQGVQNVGSSMNKYFTIGML